MAGACLAAARPAAQLLQPVTVQFVAAGEGRGGGGGSRFRLMALGTQPGLDAWGIQSQGIGVRILQKKRTKLKNHFYKLIISESILVS